MKLMPLTLTILLSTLSQLVLADQKVTYSCDNAHGTTVSKTGPVVGDKFAAKIVANMATWSSHKYLVKQDAVGGGKRITVVCREKVQTHEEGLKAIAEQERIVRLWLARGRGG